MIEWYPEFYGPEGTVRLKLNHYYIHKENKRLIMLLKYDFDYKRIMVNPLFGDFKVGFIDMLDVFENYVEYNP